MNTLQEQYQIIKNLENLLDAREIKQEQIGETTASQSSVSNPELQALREHEEAVAIVREAVKQEPLFGEAA